VTMNVHPELTTLAQTLDGALTDRLVGVYLYGPAARGEAMRDQPELNVLIVLRDLELATLHAAGPALERWVRAAGMPCPRLVTPQTLADAADVFPVELAELTERHVVIRGGPALAALPAVDPRQLRLQCERELREKLMRLQEGYALGGATDRELRRLMMVSYPTFAALFRACLRLYTVPPPSSIAAVERFCRHVDLDPSVFVEVERLREGLPIETAIPTLFQRYVTAIDRAVRAVDMFTPRSSP
jgi:hypothetical protein